MGRGRRRRRSEAGRGAIDGAAGIAFTPAVDGTTVQKRGVGIQTGRQDSIDRSRALGALMECLSEVPFPARREDLVRVGRVMACFTAPNGDRWTVADLLTDVPVAEFSSAEHVAEVVRLRWEDMADLFRPGGTGSHRPYGPTETVQEEVVTEKAVRAHDEAMAGEREPRAGP